jgi:hypothetical protein
MSFGPGGALGGGRGPQLRIHYVSNKITITSRQVDTGEIQVPIAELRAVVRCLTFTYPLFKVAVVTGGLEVAIAVSLATAFGSPMFLCAGVVAALGMWLGAWVDARRNPSFMVIEANVHGRNQVLFGTRDKREFGQVSRALMRALEDHQDTSYGRKPF